MQYSEQCILFLQNEHLLSETQVHNGSYHSMHFPAFSLNTIDATCEPLPITIFWQKLKWFFLIHWFSIIPSWNEIVFTVIVLKGINKYTYLLNGTWFYLVICAIHTLDDIRCIVWEGSLVCHNIFIHLGDVWWEPLNEQCALVNQ